VKVCSAGMWCNMPARNASSDAGDAPLPFVKPSRRFFPSYESCKIAEKLGHGC